MSRKCPEALRRLHGALIKTPGDSVRFFLHSQSARHRLEFCAIIGRSFGDVTVFLRRYVRFYTYYTAITLHFPGRSEAAVLV